MLWETKFPDTNVLINMAATLAPEDHMSTDVLSIAEQTVATNLLGPIRINPQFSEFLATKIRPDLDRGGGEKVTLLSVARHAQMWNGFGTPAELKAKNAIIDEWCKVEGTDPTKIERTTLANADPDLDLHAFHDAGIQHLILGISHPLDLFVVEKVLGRARA
jgi:hypothetical protein